MVLKKLLVLTQLFEFADLVFFLEGNNTQGYILQSLDVGMGIIHYRSLAGTAEGKIFPTFYEAIVVKCLALRHKCHDKDLNPHFAADNTTAWVQ